MDTKEAVKTVIKQKLSGLRRSELIQIRNSMKRVKAKKKKKK